MTTNNKEDLIFTCKNEGWIDRVFNWMAKTYLIVKSKNDDSITKITIPKNIWQEIEGMHILPAQTSSASSTGNPHQQLSANNAPEFPPPSPRTASPSKVGEENISMLCIENGLKSRFSDKITVRLDDDSGEMVIEGGDKSVLDNLAIILREKILNGICGTSQDIESHALSIPKKGYRSLCVYLDIPTQDLQTDSTLSGRS